LTHRFFSASTTKSPPVIVNSTVPDFGSMVRVSVTVSTGTKMVSRLWKPSGLFSVTYKPRLTLKLAELIKTGFFVI
ncbi:MAG: hypothetical protein IKD97_04920, partial [Firmicutes bacterium]|nr:hypothetical protein [Bacillota bacterium]